ncbi:putative coatomer subunit gamma-2 protein [Podospora aff. communis PSN243]|uniref:diacylglycerol cholinephosphotransferase n=1 Tax=Podospora aff. communis PSN243 TaxID=3040156 RepID=A0AAV9GYU5_9PEZI|nr:putative coatomer subunit gamma-2 protein [Podospora aff. communis PSN243]
MNYGKKDEDADTGLVKIDRTQVFQEARLFNSSPIQPRRCRILLTKIALLLYTGERFPTNEATTLFFGISKLFQNKDASLRQMVHLVIKELASSAEDIIMVTSTIMKDTGGSTDIIYRPNAIRALCRIIDATTVQSIERVMKTAIVDKNPSVSSAALVSSYHLLPIAKDVVRRWQSETQEAAASTKSSGGFSLGFSSSSGSLPVNNSTMTQYHAIGLLYQMRSHDRMALVKMVQQFGAAGAVKNPAAIVMLVRLAAQLAEEDPQLRKPMVQLLDGWLRHKSEMVNFEAAKAICDLRDVTDAEVSQAVHVLQLFLTSPRAVTKFAALRILHNFASFKPHAVHPCNPDIELLISNSNRSIATFAITTLLKTGNEASVDRLMKQISGFMSEITDEFKITIVEAIRTLCLKFPSKQAGMLQFLSGILRDEGGYEFKRAVVESMFDLIKFVPDSKEEALAHLCEFIEDCEFTKLAVRILHLLGLEGPKTSQPTKYVRYIYNRVVLENATVRAAAVTALAKFGVGQKDPEVKRSVEVLLTRCLDDVDDEVRDRAALNLSLMKEEDDLATAFVKNDTMFSLPYFERELVNYVTSEDKSAFASPFDISKIPVVTREQADAEDRTKKLTATTPSLKPPKVGASKAAPTGAEAAASASAAAQKHQQELMQIPEMKEFGAVLKSSPPVELTEAETEYVVSVIKHIFKEHIVLQYEVKNTLPATVLENVSVVATPSDEEELEEVFIIQAEKLETDVPGKVYVAFHKVGGEGSLPISTFSNVLKFTSKEIDPTTNEPEETGYDDEYEVAEFDLSGSDYVIPAFAGNFAHIWEQVGASGEEAEETLQLSGVKSIADATEQLAKTLSLQPLEGTDVPVNQTTHTLKLLGKTVNGGRVVANIRMAYSSKSGVTTKITKSDTMVYVREKFLPNLRQYKYSSVDRSLVSKYILKPFYTNVVIKCFPMRMAPNLITLTGFMFVVANFLTLLWYNPTLDQNCPPWVYYSWAVGLFLYQTFDAVDGTQARRTHQSGPLGELFDHGVDALNTSLEVLIFAASQNMGQSWYTVATLFASLLTFYVQTWDEYHTKTLTLGIVNGPVEGILILVGVYALTGYKGGAHFWQQSMLATFGLPQTMFGGAVTIPSFLYDLSFTEWYMVQGSIVLVLNTLESCRNVIKARRARGDRSRYALVGLAPFFITWAFMVLYLALQPNILHNHLVPFVLFAGIVNAYSVGQMITAHLVKLEFPYWNVIVIPLALGVIDSIGPVLLAYSPIPGIGWPSALGDGVYQVAFMFCMLGAAVGVYGSFVVDVIVTICDYLDIWCLTIKHPYVEGQENKQANGKKVQ